MDQITFSEAEYHTKKRKARCKVFLDRIDKLIPWKQLEKNVARYYPQGPDWLATVSATDHAASPLYAAVL